jgi:hypothetical protein
MNKKVFIILAVVVASIYALQAMSFDFTDSWGEHGISLEQSSRGAVSLNFSISELELVQAELDGESVQRLLMPKVFLPNDEGAPNLPVMSRHIALPQGAEAQLRVTSARTEALENINLEPAPRIPAGVEDGPLEYNYDMSIYTRDEFFPQQPVILSEKTDMRGMDVVILSVTPFQYNPVTKELLIYRDLKVEVDFVGGSSHFGEDRLRNKWFDPIISDLVINADQIPRMDYTSQNTRDDLGYEYIVVVPDDPDFIAWADSVRIFRSRQGIKTEVVTTAEVGGNNHTMIKNYISDAYNNWDIPPVAVLLLADYGNTGNTITSELRTDHPYGNTDSYITDHYYSDMNNNNMPDVIIARITAQDTDDLQTMVGKFLDYERHPPTNAHYYDEPITAMGWQTERWFQLCSETVNGFWEHELGKNPLRQNNIYSGTVGNIWSTNQNTSLVVNYFGPNGLNYIPSTPQHLHNFGWDANASSLNNAINAGAYMVMHRDHGTYTGWGEPHYRNVHLSGLTNEDLTFVFSINCLTGKFDWTGGESFTEAFHRHEYGALGLIAASDISYSFVNDTFVWGMMDNMWPQFMPDNTNPPEPRGVLPAFANAAGKYFLQSSGWPTNPGSKQLTYRLFHHHGDAFTTVYTEMPQELTVSHEPVMFAGVESFTVTADEDAIITLSVDGEIIGSAVGTGAPQIIDIIAQIPPHVVDLVVTKQNHHRYHAQINVIADGPFIVLEDHQINDELGNDNGLVEYGETIMLGVQIHNLGNENADNVQLILATVDEYISITNGTHLLNSIAVGEQIVLNDIFTFDVANDVPNEHIAEFIMIIMAADQSWEYEISAECYAPVLQFAGVEIDDCLFGNNNGMFDPGEIVHLLISVENTGGAEAYEMLVDLSVDDEFVTVIDNQPLLYGNIMPNENITYAFEVSADEETPPLYPVSFDIEMSADLDVEAADEFELVVADYYLEEYFDDWLPGGWETYASTANVYWYQNSSNNAGGIAPEARLDGSFAYESVQRLTTKPVNTIGRELLLLEFRHNMVAYSGGDFSLRVETTSDGENWNTLVSYPNTVIPATMEQIIIDNEDVGAEEFRIAWTFEGDASGFFWWNVDDIILDGNLPGLGTLQGTVALLGGSADVEDVEINVGSQTFHPDSDGYFALELLPGSYELTAMLDDYVPANLTDLDIVIDEITEIDIELEYMAPPVNLEYELNGAEITLTWELEEPGDMQLSGRNSPMESQISRPITSFAVYRSQEEDEFVQIETTNQMTYTENVQESGHYQYYVSAIYEDEYESAPSNTVEIDVDVSADDIIPAVTSLRNIYPNPFNPQTTIAFSLADHESITIEIFNIRGQLVRTLLDSEYEAGHHQIVWNGRDEKGRQLASGVYLCVMQTEKDRFINKVVLMK